MSVSSVKTEHAVSEYIYMSTTGREFFAFRLLDRVRRNVRESLIYQDTGHCVCSRHIQIGHAWTNENS